MKEQREFTEYMYCKTICSTFVKHCWFLKLNFNPEMKDVIK